VAKVININGAATPGYIMRPCVVHVNASSMEHVTYVESHLEQEAQRSM
jgi:hypothetical protein